MTAKSSLHAPLARLEPIVFAVLRIVAGALVFCHGAQKILGWFSTSAGPAPLSQIWVGGMIELVGGALIAVGLFTRAAAFIVSGMMAVAYIQFHWRLHLAGGAFLPIVNKGELAVVYCFLFLFVFARGAGAASVDGLCSTPRTR